VQGEFKAPGSHIHCESIVVEFQVQDNTLIDSQPEAVVVLPPGFYRHQADQVLVVLCTGFS